MFRDGAFCKYVCPIGQFNFVQSLVSPWEVRVREPAICTSCRTHDCIRGNQITHGCELKLFQPRKVGNLDCTFCLDCVQACPHENVGVIATVPTASLWRDGPRSGIGRLSRRFDYAVLVIVLVFGAFANAAGMVGPVVDWQGAVGKSLGWSSFFVTTLFYALMLAAVPAILAIGVSWFSRRAAAQSSLREIVCRYAWGFVPLGFAMWMAHYSFHFFTSCDAIVPVTQQFAARYAGISFGPPNWICSCCRPHGLAAESGTRDARRGIAGVAVCYVANQQEHDRRDGGNIRGDFSTVFEDGCASGTVDIYAVRFGDLDFTRADANARHVDGRLKMRRMIVIFGLLDFADASSVVG